METGKLFFDLSKIHVPGELERLQAENEELRKNLNNSHSPKGANTILGILGIVILFLVLLAWNI